MAVVSWLGSTSAGQVSSASRRIDLDMLSQRRAQQLHGFQHQIVDVDLARLQRLFAREGEQMFGQLTAAFGGLVDHPGDGLEFGTIGDRFARIPMVPVMTVRMLLKS